MIEIEVPMSETSTSQSSASEPSAAAALAPVSLEGLDLAALLCSRVCHDLISPVGAIVNGMEVLEDTNDESTKTFALDLIKIKGAWRIREILWRRDGKDDSLRTVFRQ